jgi:hypothetical protein
LDDQTTGKGDMAVEHRWSLLEYESEERLRKCLEDRDKRVLFYPATGRMRVGQLVDIEVSVASSNVGVPMKAMVVARRVRPRGSQSPRGVYLEIIEEDAARFKRLCDLADGVWRPGTRRSAPRLKADIRVSYYLPPDFHAGETVDISERGMFVRTDGTLPKVGQGLYVRMHSSPLWFPISLSTRVCWIDSVDTRRGMGLFCFDSPRALKRLASLIRKLRRRLLP